MKKVVFILLLATISGYSQDSKTLESYGPVYDIGNLDYKVDLNQEFKAVFDVSTISDYKENPNSRFETISRYLRLHRKSELENNSVKAALVVHGPAIYDLLAHQKYSIHHKEKDLRNPNYDLLTVLSENDVEIIVCGQSLQHRAIDRSMLHPDVKVGLSAMTALIQFQNKGYSLINF